MSHIKVAVRVRPLNAREIDSLAKMVVEVNKDTISITNPRLDGNTGQSDVVDSRERVKSFVFDYAYLSTEREATNYASQSQIFQDAGHEVLEAAFDGYNACIFAYGQTGSGKTYTMMGNGEEEAGLTPRILQGLFSRVKEAQDHPECSISCRVDVSYMEIYNEKVRDLLRPSIPKRGQGNERFTLKVREHPKDGPYVQDLSRHIVKDNESVQALLDKGNEKRITAATHYHDHSSRSHAIFTINFTQAKLDKDLPCETVSKIHLVDLAGSERANLTDYDRERLKEGANINKSLVTLGNVIKSLASHSANFATSRDNLTGSLIGSSQGLLSSSELLNRSSSPVFRKKSSANLFVPYRDSVLTWLLKDSLGGNSKTIMIANISPSSLYYAETLNTLRYAQRTKSIINKPTVNEDAHVKLIRDLRGEINRLRELLVSSHLAQSPSLTDIDSSLVEKLEENEAVAKSMLSNWLDKWQEAHDIMKESDIRIRRGRKTSSMGVIIDSQLPHLVGMDDDILSTGVIIYHIRVGTTTIGTENSDRRCDIVLHGPGIKTEHCVIKYSDGNVYLLPHFQASCSVNGVDITEATRLTQGDVILLGKTNMFRFNNPTEAARLRKKRKSLNDIGVDRKMSSNLEMLFRASVSHANSMGSLVTSRMDCDTPSPSHKMADHEVQDLDAFYHSEVERIQNAKEELERLQEEHAAAEEERARKEEQLMLTHERKVLEMERLERHLQLMIAENDAMRVRAEEEIQQARQQLEKERQQHQEQLACDLAELSALREAQLTRPTDSADGPGDMTTQTDDSLQECSGTQTASVEVLTELNQQRSTVQGRLKELTQKELMFTLQEFEEEQEITNKALEYELQITDAQDEICDVKYHLNELKHSISFNNFDEVSGPKVRSDLLSADSESEGFDSDLDQSHDLSEYIANEQLANNNELPTSANDISADTSAQSSEELTQSQPGSMQEVDLHSLRLSKGQRAHHNISPDRFKVSRSAESVTSRLFPQYKVKFEYKASQRENTPSPVREAHQRRNSEPRRKVGFGELNRNARSLSYSRIKTPPPNSSSAKSPCQSTDGRRRKVLRTQPVDQSDEGSRSQSQPNFSTRPRKTWEKPDTHTRSRSVPGDLTRLARPRNPLPPVKRTLVISDKYRVPLPSELKRSSARKVKKATSLSRIPETHSEDEKSKSYMNIGSLPAFATCNISENPAYTESLTHSLDFSDSLPFKQLQPKLAILPSTDEINAEEAPGNALAESSPRPSSSKPAARDGIKSKRAPSTSRSIILGIKAKYGNKRSRRADIPVEIFLPPSPLSSRDICSGGSGGGGGGGASPTPTSADKEIFIPFDKNTMLFAKSLRDQQRKSSQSDSVGSSSRKGSTTSSSSKRGDGSRRASKSPLSQHAALEDTYSVSQFHRAQSETDLRNAKENSDCTEMSQLEQQYQHILDTHSVTDISSAANRLPADSVDVTTTTQMLPSESVLELHSSNSFASIQEVDVTMATQAEEVPPVVQFYEDGEPVTPESLAKRQQLTKKALKATQVKYRELEDAVIRATKARQQNLNRPRDDSFSEDSLKGEQQAARLDRRKRRISSTLKAANKESDNFSESDAVLSDDSLAEPVIKRSSSAQKQAEELFRLREEFMDAKFSVKKDLVVQTHPSWDCLSTDAVVELPTVVSCYHAAPAIRKPILNLDIHRLSSTPVDVWSSVYSQSTSSDKFMVTARPTNSNAKRGMCTQSRTDVWGSIHPSHLSDTGLRAIVVDEVHCQSSEEGLEFKGGLGSNPLGRSTVSIVSYEDSESLAKASTATSALLLGAQSDTCSANTNDLLADVTVVNSASSDLFTATKHVPAAIEEPASETYMDVDLLTAEKELDQLDGKDHTEADHFLSSHQPPVSTYHQTSRSLNIKDADSDDTDELLACRPINTAQELKANEILAHVTHQSPAVTCQLNNDTHDSPAVTCQLDTDTCDSPADSPLSIQQIAQLLVDEVLKKSVALVSATALASSVTEDVVVTEIYFSDSSSEKSYHELVGVSSKIFTPDGTALKDEPLYFDDPPFQGRSLSAQSETVQLNGSGVQVIAVPWDVGTAPLPKVYKTEVIEANICGIMNESNQDLSHHKDCLEKPLESHTTDGKIESCDTDLYSVDQPIPIAVLSQIVKEDSREFEQTGSSIQFYESKTEDEPADAMLKTSAESMCSESDETESESRSAGSYLLENNTEVKDLAESQVSQSYTISSIAEEKEPIVLKQKSHDKLGDSAIGSDLTEDVELNNQKLPQERSGSYAATREQLLLSDSGGESITFVFMTRSHSADEINADDTVSEDIDINEVFGRSSCDADSTLGSKADVQFVRYTSEPNLRSRSANEVSPRGCTSPRSLTLFADSVDINDSGGLTPHTPLNTHEPALPLAELVNEPLIVSASAAANSHPIKVTNQSEAVSQLAESLTQMNSSVGIHSTSPEPVDISEPCYEEPILAYQRTGGLVSRSDTEELAEEVTSLVEDTKYNLFESRTHGDPVSRTHGDPDLSEMQIADREEQSTDSSATSSEHMFTAESVAGAINNMLGQSQGVPQCLDDSSKAPQPAPIADSADVEPAADLKAPSSVDDSTYVLGDALNTDKSEDSGHTYTVKPTCVDAERDLLMAGEYGSGQSGVAERKVKSMESPKAKLLEESFTKQESFRSPVQEDAVKCPPSPNLHQNQSSSKVEEWLNKQTPLHSVTAELPSLPTLPTFSDGSPTLLTLPGGLLSSPTSSGCLPVSKTSGEQAGNSEQVKSTHSLSDDATQRQSKNESKRLSYDERDHGLFNTTERGDNTTERADTIPERGDNTTERGDNATERGDNTTERGDNATERGDTIPERGDNTTERGDNATERGDNITKNSNLDDLAVEEVVSQELAIETMSMDNGNIFDQPESVISIGVETEAIKTSNQGTDALNLTMLTKQTGTGSSDIATCTEPVREHTNSYCKSHGQGTDTSGVEHLIIPRTLASTLLLSPPQTSPAVQTDRHIATQTDSPVELFPAKNELRGSIPALTKSSTQVSEYTQPLSRSRTWASQTDALDLIEPKKRMTAAGSLTFDMTTMTDIQDVASVPSSQSCLSFDMQTSTSDLIPDGTQITESLQTKDSKTRKQKLSTIGRGLSRKSSRSSIQDVLDMLPTATQTTSSLWGLQSLPLFDAAARPNEELVQAVSSTIDPTIACREIELDQIDRLIKRAEELRLAKLQMLSDQVSEANPLLPEMLISREYVKPNIPHSGGDSLPTSPDTLLVAADSRATFSPSVAAPLEAAYRPESACGVGGDLEGRDSRSSCTTVDSTADSLRPRSRSSRKAQIQELLNSVDATLAKYGVSVPTSKYDGTPSVSVGAADDIRSGTGYSRDRSGTSSAMSTTSSAVRDEQTDVDLDELDRLRKERLKITQILGRDNLPSRMWMELAEAQLNYAFGQTDTLLDALELPKHSDEGTTPKDKLTEDRSADPELLKLRTQQLEESKKKIEQRIELLEAKVAAQVEGTERRHSRWSSRAERVGSVSSVGSVDKGGADYKGDVDSWDTDGRGRTRSADVFRSGSRVGSVDMIADSHSVDRSRGIVGRGSVSVDRVDGPSQSSRRTPRVMSLAKARRQAEIEIFKIERERENSMIKSQAEKFDLDLGHSDTASVTSIKSGVTPDLTTPRQHLRRLTDERKKVVSHTVKGDAGALYTRTPHLVLHDWTSVTYPNSRANKSTSNTISKTTSHAASTRYPVSTSRDDEAIEALRRQLERSQSSARYSTSIHSPASASHLRIKSSEEIERQIQDELDKLSTEFSRSPVSRLSGSRLSGSRLAGSYQLHDDSHDSELYNYETPNLNPSFSRRTSLLHPSRVYRDLAEPASYNYKNSGVSSLAKTISQIQNYRAFPPYRRGTFY